MTERVIKFFVVGIPKPAGSKRVFVNKKTMRAIVTDDSGQAGTDWRGDVKAVALRVMDTPPIAGPVYLDLEFRFPRPQSHISKTKAGKRLKASAPYFHTNKPDTTKLIRGVEDSLTGIVWRDDSQVVTQSAHKRYCNLDEQPGVYVEIQELEATP